MTWLLVLPLLIPMATAVLTVLVRHRPGLSATFSVLGAALLLVAASALLAAVLREGPIAAQMGDWPAPFGVTLVADTLSAVLVLVTGIVGVAIALYAVGELGTDRVRFGFHALFYLLLGGAVGAFVTGDLFNLYVWFEVLLISSFGLLVLGNEPRQIDGAVKYVALNLVATTLILIGVGMVYGQTGTLNLADLHRWAQTRGDELLPVSAVLLVAFAIKAGAFPLFFWLPASYHTPSVAVSAVFAALLTKVGIYALVRLFSLVFPGDHEFVRGLLLASAVATMVIGVLAAAAQNEFRRILSIHIVSQIGYMLLGLALLTPLALAGVVLYLVHNMLVKTGLFLVAGIARAHLGSFELARLGGLWLVHPVLAILFLLGAFSLAGFPPFSGFWGKLMLFRASLDVGAYVALTAAVVTSLLTTYSMTKIWSEAFWKAPPAGSADTALPRSQQLCLFLPLLLLTGSALLLGLVPAPFLALAERAAQELIDPSRYLIAVLGPQAIPGAVQ
jgi:multicomponent Na+:H+ antiporter subunit D